MATPRDVLEKLPLADLKVLAEGIAIADRRKASSVSRTTRGCSVVLVLGLVLTAAAWIELA